VGDDEGPLGGLDDDRPRPFLSSLALAGLGGVLLAVLLSSLLARRLTRPIGSLAAATRRVAAGETDVAVPAEGGDELAVSDWQSSRPWPRPWAEA
jgi:HAMP domain-containing protein